MISGLYSQISVAQASLADADNHIELEAIHVDVQVESKQSAQLAGRLMAGEKQFHPIVLNCVCKGFCDIFVF